MNSEINLEKMADEIKTIRGLLDQTQRKLPLAGWVFFVLAAFVFLVTCVWYWVPGLRTLGIDDQILWYWLPAGIGFLGIGALGVWQEYKKRKSLMILGPLRDMLFARFVIFPALWFPIWLLRYEPGLVSLILIGFAGIQGVMIFILPRMFRFVAVSTLVIGFTEYFAGLHTPEMGLLNGTLVALAFTGVGLAVRGSEKSHG